MTYLWEIRTYTQQLVEAVSAAVALEITIVDNEGRRIAGTGTYKQQIGSFLPREFIFHQVLRTGEKVVITEPGYSLPCKTCAAQFRNCPGVRYICAPIWLDGAVMGGIGIIAAEPWQAEALLRSKDALLQFVDRLGDLLAVRAERDRSEERLQVMNEQFSTIMGVTDEAILAVNGEGILTHINPAGEALLGVRGESVIGRRLGRQIRSEAVQASLSSRQNLTDVEMTFSVGSREIRVLGNLRVIVAGGTPSGVVCFFRDIERARKQAFRLTGRTLRISFDDIHGQSPALEGVVSVARRVASSSATIILRGESGTGKELFARAIHWDSPRRNRPFVAINCAAIPDTLLESELFGYEGGSFTGARREGNAGKLELADGGTVFLDEIGDMPLTLQAKLLRVLQERVVERVGGRAPIPIDVRIVAATNRNLEQMVEEGHFREDLYYRLNVIPLILPPLRQRRGDIPFLANRALQRCAQNLGKELGGFSAEAMQLLEAYEWPGNIRELENAVEYAANMEQGTLVASSSLPQRLPRVRESRTTPRANADADRSFADQLTRLLDEHGRTTEGKRRAAHSLGISLATLYRRLAEGGSRTGILDPSQR